MKAALIIGMALIAMFAVWLNKKILPKDDVIYPIWAILIITLFNLVILYS